MIQAKNVKIRYNRTPGSWSVEYQGPSGVYTLREWGLLPDATLEAVYKAAGQAVLAASNLVVPPINEVEVVWEEVSSDE
jgi:hypothetical protein